jgi:hypothetical protein
MMRYYGAAQSRRSKILDTYLGLARTIYIRCIYGVYMLYIRYFWQGNDQIYGHIRCIFMVLANPTRTVLGVLSERGRENKSCTCCADHIVVKVCTQSVLLLQNMLQNSV